MRRCDTMYTQKSRSVMTPSITMYHIRLSSRFTKIRFIQINRADRNLACIVHLQPIPRPDLYDHSSTFDVSDSPGSSSRSSCVCRADNIDNGGVQLMVTIGRSLIGLTPPTHHVCDLRGSPTDTSVYITTKYRPRQDIDPIYGGNLGPGVCTDRMAGSMGGCSQRKER